MTAVLPSVSSNESTWERTEGKHGRQTSCLLSSLAAGAGRGFPGPGTGGFTAREADMAPAQGRCSIYCKQLNYKRGPKFQPGYAAAPDSWLIPSFWLLDTSRRDSRFDSKFTDTSSNHMQGMLLRICQWKDTYLLALKEFIKSNHTEICY